MHDTVANELGVAQRRDHGEHTLLLREFQMGLETHQVIHTLCRIVLPQLDNGVRLLAGVGVNKAHRLQGAETEGVGTAAAHNLHRHTAFENPLVLKAVDFCFLRMDQLMEECFVLFLVHGAVDIIGGAPVIAALPPGLGHIHRLGGNQGCGSVKEVEVSGAEVLADGLAEVIRGQRAGGDNHRTIGNLHHFFGNDGDIRVIANFLGDHIGETLAVNCQTAAGLHTGGVSAEHNEAPHAAQFLFQQAHRIFQLIATQRIGTNQLREGVHMVSRRLLMGFHLI